MITHETPQWFIDQDRMGHILLVRKSDCGSVYMQGDDAALMRRNVEALEQCHADDGAAFNRAFTHLCEGYSDVLETDIDYSHR